MTDWQLGYSDAYVHPKVRGYPAKPDNEEYMDGFMFGQQEYNKSRKGE